MKIIFRADADRETGLGHLTRCLTLANALRAEGAECGFISRRSPINALVTEAGHALLELPEERLGEIEDATTSRSLVETPADWLVIDHYGLGSTWESAVRGCAHRLAAVDDLANRPHEVDLLLDQNELDNREHRYDGLLPKGCAPLLGTRYALLRPEFTDAYHERDGTLRRLLVNFGGTDPGNATSLALSALEKLDWFNRSVDVVIGGLHPQAEAIASRCAMRPNLTLHLQTPHIGELMRAADLALGAGGTSTWERCAAGLPSVILTIADNQRPLAAAVAKAGAALWPGDAKATDVEHLATLLMALDQCPHWLRSMSHAARALCDGRGTARVVRALLAPELLLRPAASGDEAFILEWRNHPEIRRYSGSGQPIEPTQHHEWFSTILADPDRALLIAESLNKAVGVVRFDDLASNEPEVSIYLDPKRMGTGWGAEILRAATQWLHSNQPAAAIRARIHPENHASQTTFRKAGYQPQTHWWRLDL